MKKIATIFIFSLLFNVSLSQVSLPRSIDRAFEGKSTIPIWVLLPSPLIDIHQDQGSFDKLPEPSRNRRLLHNSNPDYRDRPISQEWITKVTATGAKFRSVSRYLQAVSVDASREQINRIIQIDGIRDIKPVAVGKRTSKVVFDKIENTPPEITEVDTLPYGRSRAQIQQINVIPLHEQGYSGKGVIGGLLDTGFRLTHDAFDSLTILAERDFIFNDNNTANQPADTSEQWVHGTMCLSALGGYAPTDLIGPAYKATMIVGKTENVRSETPVEEDYYIAGLEWCDSLGARGVSTSLGYLDWYTWSDMNGDTALCTQAVDIAAARGMLVATAAGNENGSNWNHIIAPADADSCLAVAAVDTLGEIASFSSRGPSFDGRIKPEVAACGVRTRCATPQTNSSYNRASGTSLATPLVGGAMFLLWEKHPYWTAMMMHQALRLTASQRLSPDTLLGWGIINVAAADTFTFGGNQPPTIDTMIAMMGVTNGLRLHFTVLDPENDSLVIDTKAVYEVMAEQSLGRYIITSGTGWVDIGQNVELTGMPLYVEVTLSDRVHILYYHAPIIEVSVDENMNSNLPTQLNLSVFPNPFNSQIKVSIDLPRTSPVNMILFDVNGRQIWSEKHHKMAAGHHQVQLKFNPLERSSGIYYLKISDNYNYKISKIVYLK